jgi:hypothetical protein
MPNQSPNEWTNTSRAALSPVCGSGACVDAQKVDGGVLVTSTVPGNEGYVRFTSDEWSTFIGEVQAGKWDHTL